MAKALADWIPNVLQGTECFYSDEAIEAGQHWNNEINKWLAGTDFGIVCVTPENTESRWLNFEAGALAKKLNDESRVVPVTLGFSPSALDFPLRQFNGVQADQPGIKKLIQSLVTASEARINLDLTFDLWWQKLEESFNTIPASADDVSVPEPPDSTELLTEILGLVRGIARDQTRGYSAALPVGLGIHGAQDAERLHLMRSNELSHRIHDRFESRYGTAASAIATLELARLAAEKIYADAEADAAAEFTDEMIERQKEEDVDEGGVDPSSAYPHN